MQRRILVADDAATDRILLKARLTAAHYDVSLVSCGPEALARARAHPPDLILLDCHLLGRSGFDVCRTLRTDPRTRHCPVIMTTHSTGAEAFAAALQSGADDLLRKPVDDRVLLARIRSLLRGGGLYEMAREFEDLGFAEPEPAFALPARIFLIAQSAHTAVTWRHRIGAQMRDPVSVLSPGAVLDGAATSPDLFVIEADPSRTQCLQLVSELRSRRDSRHAAICLVVNDASGVDLATALDIGADDAVAEGFDGAEIALRARALIRRKRHADGQRARVTEGLRLALADPLTGLSNRRHAMPVLARMITAARLSKSRCAVMILDLDRFKTVNDRFGHAAGDSVLTEAAQRLASLCRPSDLVARIGGEEFLIARSGVDEAAAFAFAQGLRSAISARPMAGQNPGHSLDLAVTASIGLALSGITDEPAEAVLARADMALLAAKRDGRDQVSIGRGLSAA